MLVSEKLGIGTSTPGDSLSLNGSLGFSLDTWTSSNSAGQHSIILTNTSTGNLTVVLPTPSAVLGRIYTVKKISSGGEVRTSYPSGNIDGVSTVTLGSDLGVLSVIGGSSQWYILSSNGNITTSTQSQANIKLLLDFLSDPDEPYQLSGNTSATLGGGSGNATFVSGPFGQAIDLSGNSLYLNLEPDSYFSADEGQSLSFLAWIYMIDIDATNTEYILFNGLNAANPNYSFYLNNTGGTTTTSKLTFSYRKDSGAPPHLHTFEEGTTFIHQGSWTHVGFSYTFSSGNTMKLYINGQVSGNASWTSGNGYAAPNLSSNAFIGKLNQGGGQDFLDGYIGNIRMYDRTLTADEVLALYNEGR